MYYVGGEKYAKETDGDYFGNMDINLKSIGFFIKVVECGGVTKASEKLYVSQPYLSKNIKSLEDRLGFELFKREKNRLVLTAKGTEFYKTLRPLIYSVQENIDRIKNLETPKINIAVQYTLDFYKLLESGILPQNFDIDGCSVECLDPFEIVNKLNTGTVDTAIILSDYAEYFAEYEKAEIGTSERVIVVSSQNKFANKEFVTMNDIKNEELIFYIEGNLNIEMTLLMARKYCERYGFDVSNISFAENYQTALFNVTKDSNKIIFSENLMPCLPNKRLTTVPIKNSYNKITIVINKKLSEEKLNIIHGMYNQKA